MRVVIAILALHWVTASSLDGGEPRNDNEEEEDNNQPLGRVKRETKECCDVPFQSGSYYVDRCLDYGGDKSVTKSGLTCQRWDSDEHHIRATKVKQKFKLGEFGLGKHNYCRNPTGHSNTWCYTTDSKKRWDDCEIRDCEKGEQIVGRKCRKSYDCGPRYNCSKLVHKCYFLYWHFGQPLPENHAGNCLWTRGETRSCCVLFGNGYERFMGSSNDWCQTWRLLYVRFMAWHAFFFISFY